SKMVECVPVGVVGRRSTSAGASHGRMQDGGRQRRPMTPRPGGAAAGPTRHYLTWGRMGEEQLERQSMSMNRRFRLGKYARKIRRCQPKMMNGPSLLPAQRSNW